MSIPDAPWIRETELRGTDYMYEWLGGYTSSDDAEDDEDYEEPDDTEQSAYCSDCPPEECTGHCMSCYYR